MHSHVLAAAGLQDCADTGVCADDSGLWTFFFGLLAASAVVVVWISLACLVTIAINGRSMATRRQVGWLAVVWLIPLVGAGMWWRQRHSYSPERTIPDGHRVT
ncbi:hypothetical protein [Gordonia sp. DT101]|uniref:hypothetical protein n=1 Tax=Gordonia sp. DT101 TaxID=3416545 RepID=UPI003CF2904A